MTLLPVRLALPCAGGATTANVSGSLSGSVPASGRVAAVSSGVVMDAGAATGARFVWVTDQPKVVVAVSAPSFTVMVTALDGAAPKATVPLITPLAASTARPAGRPSALKSSVSRSGSLAARASVTVDPSALVCGPGFVSTGARLVWVTDQPKVVVAVSAP